MQTLLNNWADTLLDWLGFSAVLGNGWDRWVAFFLVILIVLLFDFLCRVIVVRSMRKVIRRIDSLWANQIFSSAVLNRTCNIISAVVLAIMLPAVFDEQSMTRTVINSMAQIYLIIAVFRFINALIYAIFNIIASRPAWHDKPIKGLRQTAQGIAALICVILIISILVNKSPTILLTGLGASAAITALIFRDSILGFVSGIQLSSNDMLKVGDWISVPKYNVSGSVEEVSLTTVKLRSRDNTVVTIPPYLLVSESFQNLRPMQQSGGRRVMRSINIDMTSVRFCTAEMIARYRQIDLLREYIDEEESRIGKYNAGHGVKPDGMPINGLRQTNLGIFRTYMERYIRTEVPINKDMAVMVRQLQPTENGIPVELYFFANTVVLDEYEKVQSDVFDYVLAVIPEFDLRVFQNPTGHDIAALRPEPIEKSSARPE